MFNAFSSTFHPCFEKGKKYFYKSVHKMFLLMHRISTKV